MDACQALLCPSVSSVGRQRKKEKVGREDEGRERKGTQGRGDIRIIHFACRNVLLCTESMSCILKLVCDRWTDRKEEMETQRNGEGQREKDKNI